MLIVTLFVGEWPKGIFEFKLSECGVEPTFVKQRLTAKQQETARIVLKSRVGLEARSTKKHMKYKTI